MSDLHDGEAPHTLAFGIATRIVVPLTRKISLEPLRWIENGVARGVEDGMSADELLDAYQRGVLAVGKEDVEEDDETVDVEAPKDFDHEKAASEGAKSSTWAKHARAAAPSGARVVLGDIKAGHGYVHVIDAAMAAEQLLAPPPAPAPRAPPSPPSSRVSSFAAHLATPAGGPRTERTAAGAHADIHLLRHAESATYSALRWIVEASAAQWAAQGKL